MLPQRFQTYYTSQSSHAQQVGEHWSATVWTAARCGVLQRELGRAMRMGHTLTKCWRFLRDTSPPPRSPLPPLRRATSLPEKAQDRDVCLLETLLLHVLAPTVLQDHLQRQRLRPFGPRPREGAVGRNPADPLPLTIMLPNESPWRDPLLNGSMIDGARIRELSARCRLRLGGRWATAPFGGALRGGCSQDLG